MIEKNISNPVQAQAQVSTPLQERAFAVNDEFCALAEVVDRLIEKLQHILLPSNPVTQRTVGAKASGDGTAHSDVWVTLNEITERLLAHRFLLIDIIERIER